MPGERGASKSHNNRLQQAVMDKMPTRMRRRAAAEPGRYVTE
jgi:hypothetical protein